MKKNPSNSLYKLFTIATAVIATCLLVRPAFAFVSLAGWEAGGLTASGPSPYTPTSAAAGLSIVGLTKGSGVTNTTTANVWGGNSWTNAGIADSEAEAIAGSKFFTFSFAPLTNYTVSFNSIDKFYYSHSGTGPGNGVLEYSLDGVNFTDVQTISYATSGSVTIDLSGVSALQNVGYGTNVTFRVVNWGASGFSGTWYIANGNSSGNDFDVLGTITQTATGQPPGNVTVSPTNVVTNANNNVTFTVTATGDTPTYSWYQEVGGTTNLVSTSGPAFTLNSVTPANSGSYQVVLANASGMATSSVVTLTVVDPAITSQPVSITNVLGDIDNFNATTVSSQPVQLTWYYNHVAISNYYSSALTNAITLYVTNTTAATNLSGYTLVVSNIYGSVTSAVVTAIVAVTPSVEITRWDFNATNTYSSISNITAAIGTGIAMPATTSSSAVLSNFTYSPGTLSDPGQLIASANNNAFALTGIPTATPNKTAGFQYNVSTVGYQQILLTWNERHSATGSKYMRVQYSTNGTDFVDGDVVTFDEVAYLFYSSDLSSKPGVANNPNFAFRVVAEWESTAIGTTNAAYDGTSSAFGATGTIRHDLMTVWGNPASSVTPISLTITGSGTNVILTWSDPTAAFSLQAASIVTGPYTNIPSATSPYTNHATSGNRFFRLKSN